MNCWGKCVLLGPEDQAAVDGEDGGVGDGAQDEEGAQGNAGDQRAEDEGQQRQPGGKEKSVSKLKINKQ